jgi:hypothetical protein
VVEVALEGLEIISFGLIVFADEHSGEAETNWGSVFEVGKAYEETNWSLLWVRDFESFIGL